MLTACPSESLCQELLRVFGMELRYDVAKLRIAPAENGPAACDDRGIDARPDDNLCERGIRNGSAILGCAECPLSDGSDGGIIEYE